MTQGQNKQKIALISICLNQPYWQYISPMIESAKKFLLKGHDIDFICWSDMPPEVAPQAKIIPTTPTEWPLPTLFRYHLFLQQETLLSEYDVVLYCDADMLFVSPIRDDILGNGLTSAVHPMYYLDKKFNPPYEPFDKSTAFIPRPGRVLDENGKKRFQPLYYAGGFQGGRTYEWINAMKEMKKMIDLDFQENNHIPIWNDESVWNAYLFKNPPSVVLPPSYIYPDSLIKAYYMKLWGRNWCPKLITLTKPFSLTKDGGAGLQQALKTL